MVYKFIPTKNKKENMISALEMVPEMSSVDNPTHIVKCSGVREFAYVVSLKSHKVFKKSWIKKNDTDDDDEAIHAVNESLPDCEELSNFFSGKLKKSLSEYYLGDKVIGLTDMVSVDKPDAIFLQRISPKLKTFDMIFFYGSKYIEFNIVDKSDLKAIMSWYDSKIYSFGLDPLPLSQISKQMKQMEDAGEENIYDKIYKELCDVESERSESEYEPPSDESESETDSDLDLDEEYENDLGDTCNEYEEEDEDEDEDEEEDDEEEYVVAEHQEDEEDDTDNEFCRANKRRKF